MKMPDQEWEKDITRQLFSDGYNLGEEAIQNPDLKQGIFSSLEKMFTIIDELISIFTELSSDTNRIIQCRNGCAWCCHQEVFGVSYEMFYLTNFIADQMPEHDRRELKQKSIDKMNFSCQFDAKEVLLTSYPCPMLGKNDSCSVYPARPIACRIYMSANVDSCKEKYYHPENNKVFPDLFSFMLKAGRMLNEGFSARLREHGLKNKEWRLEEGVIFAMDSANKKLWLSGGA